eukprot:366472-Chlamydomonas_euryale.AAC.21
MLSHTRAARGVWRGQTAPASVRPRHSVVHAALTDALAAPSPSALLPSSAPLPLSAAPPPRRHAA